MDTCTFSSIYDQNMSSNVLIAAAHGIAQKPTCLNLCNWISVLAQYKTNTLNTDIAPVLDLVFASN